VPMVDASIGGAVGHYFAVDTGSPWVAVFSAFIDAHPDQLESNVTGKAQKQNLFVIVASGVGGQLGLVPTQVDDFHFGGVDFQRFTVMQVIAAPSFEGEDTDGLIGYEFLQYFTVYFDYNDQLLILQPNSLLTKKS
jgi:hypothetical protein